MSADPLHYEGKVEAWDYSYESAILLRDFDGEDGSLAAILVERFGTATTGDNLGKLRITIEQIEPPTAPPPRIPREREEIHPDTPEILAELKRREEEANELTEGMVVDD